jgi:type IV secretion system protein VirD4
MSKVVDGIIKDLKNIPESLRKKMKGTDKNKLIRMSIPYVIVGYFCDKSAWMFRQVEGDLFPRLMDTASRLGEAFANPLPSFNPMDLLFGVACGVGFRLIVYFKAKNAKKFRHGVEYGSARWGNAKDIEPYMDPVFENNIILTASERLMMSGRPSSPKYARNKNILVIGGSGSGKTRFFVKPNLMQMHSSYVVTDPKGTQYGILNAKNHA